MLGASGAEIAMVAAARSLPYLGLAAAAVTSILVLAVACLGSSAILIIDSGREDRL
jgi:hypothetical protein